MARVRSLDAGHQSVAVHPTEVDCFYQIVERSDGSRLLHLTTFGSDGRETHPKSSQSLQLDADIALQLVDVIHRTFSGA